MSAAVTLILVDLDGTLYVGDRAVDGAAPAVQSLRDMRMRLRFTTNTDSMPPAAVVAKLEALGIPVAHDEVITPLALARQLLAGAQDARALVVAAPAVREYLGEYLARPGEQPTHVLVADPSFGADYAQLDEAFSAVRGGARLVATQMGRWVRREHGDHLDTGGWVRLLEYATETQALVLGKPSADFFALALAGAAVTAREALVVGDDRMSDIAGGLAVGSRTVLVRTGKAGGGSGPEPHQTVDSIADVPALLARV